MKIALMTLAFLASGSAYAASNNATLIEKNISLNQANSLASAAIASCAAQQYNVAVTVVDRAGIVKAVQRMDNAGPHTVEASRMKAFTALSSKNSSGKVMEAAQKNPGAANMTAIPGYLLLAGGVPVKSGDQVIGAIGIGGAPGGHLDETCALEALKSFDAS